MNSLRDKMTGQGAPVHTAVISRILIAWHFTVPRDMKRFLLQDVWYCPSCMDLLFLCPILWVCNFRDLFVSALADNCAHALISDVLPWPLFALAPLTTRL